MNKTHTKKYTSFIVSIFSLYVFFFLPVTIRAAVLLPGNITTCGELAVPGTYTITQNIVGSSDTCFLVSSDNVVIEGGGYTITGTASTAIDARAYTSSVLTEGAHGYTNLIINDLTLSGYTTGIDLSGNSDSTGTGVNNGYGGDAGDVAIYYSYVGSVISNGGNSSSQAYGGLGGNIAFTDTNLNISNSTISALGGVGTTGRNTNGGVDLNYSGTLNTTNITLSALSYLNDNATTYTNYVGGSIPLAPGNISSCGTLMTTGTYTLTQNIVSTSTCFIIGANDIIINGNGYSITGATTTSSFAINASTFSNFTLASTTVNTFTNLITSSSSVVVSGHNLDLSNKFIAAGSLTLNYTGTLSKIGATVSSLSFLTVNGTSYGAQGAGQLFDWTARDSSRTWQSITSSADGTKLAAVAYSGQIYTSTDSGVTWTARESSRNWYSITSSSDGTKIAAAVSNGQIYTSIDSGVTWTARDSSRNWYSITSSSDGTKLAAVVQSGQIYTSTDSGVTWTARESSGSWQSITSSADGTKLAAVVNGGQIYTSTDSGVTWTPRDSSRNWYSITSSSDGTKLAAVARNGQIYTSTDSGVTWKTRDSSRLWLSITSSADGTKLAAVVQSGQIYTHQDDIAELKVDILSPQSAAVSSVWSPIVSWGSATSCYYSYDNFVSTSTANCASLGSDISNPGLGSHTLYVKGIDANGVVVEKNVSFTLSLPITITAPTLNQTVTSWNPIIDWDPNNTGDITNCYYSYDNFVSTSTANCAGTGGDILPPSSQGSNILSLKVVNVGGSVGVSGVSFIYSSGFFWNPRESNRNWYSITSSADGTKLAAVVQSGQIYTSSDSGVTWTPRDSSRQWWSVTSSSDGTKLVAVVNSGQIYTSTDSGVTWTPRDSSRNWRSVTSSADGTKLAVVVNGGQIYTSTDSGVTWTPRDSSRNWQFVTSSSDGTKLAAVVLGGQIYTSTDSGATWTARESSRNWNSITSSADGTKLAAVVSGGQIYTSTDSGVTWTARESSRSWQSITSSADGTKLAAVVWSGGQIHISTDSGVTWTARESSRLWQSVTSSSDGTKLAAVVQSGQIYTYDSNTAITVIRPVISESVLARAWSSLVDWGSSVSCYYSYNNFVSTSTANCASNGADIAYPLVRGTNTLYVRSVNALNTVTDKFVSFDFDSFVWLARESSRQWRSIVSNSVGDKLAAIATSGQIYTSTDYGITWTARNSSRNWFSITSNSTGNKLAAVVYGGQIHTSTDYGITWSVRDSSRNWYRITSSADGTKLAAVVDGGQIYTSANSGETWTARDSSRSWTSITSSADGTKLAAVVSNGQIYTSTDSGLTWTARDSNRFWTSITSSADGTKLAAVVGNGQIYTSIDSGLTWTPRDSSRNWSSITASSDGTKLAAVASSGQIYTSTDSGVNWTASESNRNWQSVTSSADGTKLAASVLFGRIYTFNSVPYISSPSLSSTVTTWSPSVDWSNALTCEYSYNNSTWSGVSCSSAGSDIPAPTIPGATTLYLKGTDFQSVVSTSSVSFTYLTTQSGSSISQCGNITSPGTYTLTQNITGVSGTCFVISANNVTINGAGFTVTAAGGNTSYAVTSGSYTGLNLQDITFSGFGQGNILSTATTTYSGTDIDLSNSTTTASSLVITYTNTLTTLNTYFSNLSSLIINNISLGNFVAGIFNWNQQDISTCQTLSSPGNYKLTQDITEVSDTCFIIDSDRVIIDGDGHTVSGEVGNTSYAIVATSTDADAYTYIGVRDLTLTGFDGGVDARGADGDVNQAWGKNGGKVTLYNVNFPTDKVAVNASGGNALYEGSGTVASGGSAGSPINITNSTVGSFILNGGDTVGDTGVGYDNGNVAGGNSGTVNNVNSNIGSITANIGAGYIPGCMDNSYDNYNASATYDDGSCTNLAIGIERDNPLGNTVSGPIDFYYYHNYGVVNGDANYYQNDLSYSNFGGGNNYGTTTGFGYFNDDYNGGGASNLGYVGGGAGFGGYSSNQGIVDGNVTLQYGSNSGTINGNADLSGGGYNTGTINGDAVFYSNNDYSGYYNQGTVTGTITNLYGCTDISAVNYDPNVQNDDGSCAYYGAGSNLPVDVTFNGSLTFYNGYSNYGTINGDAWFYADQGSTNYGTTTGDVTFYGYYTGSGHDSSDNTLYVDGGFNYIGTGHVGGNIFDNNGIQISFIYFSSGSSNEFVTKGPVTFNDTTYNNGIIYYGDATFNTTYYASTTPMGGVMSFETGNWYGNVKEMVLGSDSQPITTYVFYGNTINMGIINGDAIFYNNSYNAGTVNGNVTYMNASGGTLTLTGSQEWSGTITGTIKGADGIDITNLIFNDSSTNETTIASTTTVVFNNNASNNGTVLGDATFNGTNFQVGTVNGTATLSGLAQTIQGVSNVLNFVKQSFSRDTLFLQQGSTLNISGLATIFGADADNLLTIRSTSPNTNANLNINGTLNADFLRIKNITNSGLSQNVSTRTVFNDGGNTGFTFPANSTPSSRGAITSTYTPPSLPPSRISTPTPTPTPTPVATNNSNRTVSQSGTIDSFFTKTVAPLLFRNNTRFDVLTTAGRDVGNTYIPNPLKDFQTPSVIKFATLPTNFLTNVSKFLFTQSENNFKGYSDFTDYLNSKGVNVNNPQDIVKLGSKPIKINETDNIDVEGVYILNYPSNITYNKKTGATIQSVKTQPGKNLIISLLGNEKITGTYVNQSITFSSNGNTQTLNITTSLKPGTYTLKTSGSPISLIIEVSEPIKVQLATETKKGGFIQWVKGLFRR